MLTAPDGISRRRRCGGLFVPADVAKRFRITRLALPKKMIENGPSENMFVYWQGDATFPVTLYIAEPTCAENVQKVPADVLCTE